MLPPRVLENPTARGADFLKQALETVARGLGFKETTPTVRAQVGRRSGAGFPVVRFATLDHGGSRPHSPAVRRAGRRDGGDTTVGNTHEKWGLMAALKKLLAGYMVGVAVFVAFWFVCNPFFEAPGVWDVANYLMAVALVLALASYARRSSREARETGLSASRGPMKVNLGLYLTAGLTILFFRNWFLEISGQGDESSATTGMVWIVVNVLFPLVAGTAGLFLWRESARR